MSRSCAARPSVPDLAGLSQGEIEDALIRAYVRLALLPFRPGGHRSVTIARVGPMEVRISEIVPGEAAAHHPPFWVEIVARAGETVVDSCGCYEFDEDELAAAVEIIVQAQAQHSRSH